MNWILILVVFSGWSEGGAAAHHVPFKAREACQEAARSIVAQVPPATHYSTQKPRIYAWCVGAG